MKRTFPATLTLWMVLITILWNALRLWTSLAWQSVLIEFSASISPAVSAFIGSIWIILGIILYWSIWQEKVWAWKMLLGTSAGYTVWYWSERLFIQNPRPNLMFAVIVNLGLIIPIFLTIKSLSREAYERKIENPKVD